jgi:hypothetical protein
MYVKNVRFRERLLSHQMSSAQNVKTCLKYHLEINALLLE